MPTLAETVAGARERLVAGGIPSDEASGDAEVLARHVLGWDLTRYVLSRGDAPPAAFSSRYDALIARRLAREPVSQIVGIREFWGMDFEVSRDVLTPRPETELIVEEALAAFPDRARGISIVDVGTGSGCLAVALAHEFPHAQVTATDVSDRALEIAERNAVRHRVEQRITFVRGDLLENVTRRADLIVSNPPYVPETDAPSLAPEVRDHEPSVALFGGADGLAIYRRLLPSARSLARSRAPLILEVGYDQHAIVKELAASAGWTFDRSRQDLQGITRTLLFRNVE
jgi:release factor glutamine methyltransferase